MNRKEINALFEHRYPTQPVNETLDFNDMSAISDRKMEVHVTRSHFGDLLIVSADTGRGSMPKMRYNEHSWLAHIFPQCATSGGWRTRFCGGNHELNEPNIIMAMFYRAEPNEMCDHGIMEVTDAWALVLLRDGDRELEVFMEAPMPQGSVGILTDDGLESIYNVLIDLVGDDLVDKHSRRLEQLNESDMPNDVVKALRKGVEHVAWSFGQGPLDRKR